MRWQRRDHARRRRESGVVVARVRADFPILGRQIGSHPLVYLDSAATTQKPVHSFASTPPSRCRT